MRFNFRKLGSVLASTAMLSSTVALAAAASFPAPFVTNSGADVAIVHGGADAAYTDLVALSDISTHIATKLAEMTASGSGGTSDSVSGEVYELFTSGSPLLLNSTLNAVRSTVSDSHLPTVLKDGVFETTTNVDYTQRINLGSTPRLEFKQQPTGDDDPQFGFSLSTTASTGYIYNATISFESNVNFTHADSVGEELTLFGKKYTVGGATTSTKLVLLGSSQKLSLFSDSNPAETVMVDDEEFIVELVDATATDATIKVTDSEGNSDTKEVTEANSRTIQGLEVTVETAGENNQRYSATISVGSSRVTFQDGSQVKLGTDEKAVEGTQVEFWQINDSQAVVADLGEIVVQITTDSSDRDAIFPGGEFIDPIFESFKVDFSGVSVPTDSTSDREDIIIKNSGNDKMSVNFKSHDGSEAKTVNWVINNTKSQVSQSGQDLAGDSDGSRIVVVEQELVNKSEFFVLSSDDEGGLYEITEIVNSSSGFSDDYVTLKNVMTGKEDKYSATSEGTITGVTSQGKTYTITYTGASTISQEARQIRVNQGESTSNNLILFPTIATSKGAKLAFYEPAALNLSKHAGTEGVNVTGLDFQDGDGFTSFAIAGVRDVNGSSFNITIGSTTTCVGALGLEDNATSGLCNNETTIPSIGGAVGKLNFNVSVNGTTPTVYLIDPGTGNHIYRPALILIEEKDDASNYGAAVVTLDAGYDGDSAGIGVSDVVRTWGADGTNDEVQLESNSDLYQDMDLWGTLFELDKSDSDQTTARISYPDDQVTASVYIGAADASIVSGGSSGGVSSKSLGSVSVPDSEVSSVSGKNLIVVGGSCVNSVASDLLGGAGCGQSFTDATSVGSGQYLIETFSRSGGKVATLVAGYNAGETVNAGKALITQTIDTSVGKKYTGSTATDVSAVVDSA